VKKYIVDNGDTMWKISHATGVKLNLLLASNPQVQNPNILPIGSLIWIPELGKQVEHPAVSKPATQSAVESALPHASQSPHAQSAVAVPGHQMGSTAPMGENKPVKTKTPMYFGYVWPHVVQQQETWEMVCQTYGIDMKHLKLMNSHHPQQLLAGHVLYIPSPHATRLWKKSKKASAQTNPANEASPYDNANMPESQVKLPETQGFPKVNAKSGGAGIPMSLPPSPLPGYGQHSHLPFRSGPGPNHPGQQGPQVYYGAPVPGYPMPPAPNVYGYPIAGPYPMWPPFNSQQAGFAQPKMGAGWYGDVTESSSWERESGGFPNG